MIASYHCHTKWSDGDGEVADYIRAAHAKGIGKIGISDHYVLTPDCTTPDWSMPLDALDDYIEDVASAACTAGDNLVVKTGIEADYFPGGESSISEALSGRPLDYIIGAVHSVDGFPIDDQIADWEALQQRERNDIIRGYWVRIRQMAESGLFHIVAHLDLTKKFGFHPNIDISTEIRFALDAIARAGMIVELNTSGWYDMAKEAYPSIALLKACRSRDIAVIISSDAHHPANITRGFSQARRTLRSAGYLEQARLA